MAKKPAKIARKSTAKSKPKSAHRKAATRKPQGLLVGGLLTLVPHLAQKPKINLLSGFLFGLLVIVPWWLALAATKP